MSTRRKRLFDMVTTIWAMTLLVAAMLYVTTTPVFAIGGGGDELDCYTACAVACDEDDGCNRYYASPTGCQVECRNGVIYNLTCPA